MSASNKLIQAAAGVGGGEPDADFANTVLLLNADDASNGGQNNTFLDSSSNTHTITRNGNVTQGSFSPFSVDEGKWGNYFDGSGDYLTAAADADFQFGTGDFTVEAWVYVNSTAKHKIFDNVTPGVSGGTAGRFLLLIENTQVLKYYNPSEGFKSTTNTIDVNSWNHVAVARSGTTIKMFINGVEGFSGTSSTNFSLQNCRIGQDAAGGGAGLGDYNGYISNFRIVKGTAVYTAAFTPPTVPLTDITNTSILTCQSNRFVDNSSNAHSITVNGDTKVVPFSPFPQTTAYDASTNGGSGYFDGTGDSLTIPASTDFAFGTGDFTIEFWGYFDSIDNFDTVYIHGNTGGTVQLFFVSGKLRYNNNSVASVLDTATTIPTNEWMHFAIVRSGGTAKWYLNGVEDASTSDSTNWSSSATDLTIGRDPINGRDSKGYLTDLRVVKGTAVYTSAFTPPTAPLTDVSGTSLLCNFTNASIVDATGKNVLETVGNAQVDTTTVKYGTGAMEFDGTGDGLTAPNNEAFDFGSGDFTLEAWVYMTTTSHVHHIFSKRTSGGAANTNWILEIISGDYVFNASDGSSYIVSSLGNAAGTINTWQHIAITRSGNDFKMFLDGTQAGSTITNSSAISSTARDFNIGLDPSTSNNRMEGYIDDIRITKGIARYTANFTPPERALPVIGEE